MNKGYYTTVKIWIRHIKKLYKYGKDVLYNCKNMDKVYFTTVKIWITHIIEL